MRASALAARYVLRTFGRIPLPDGALAAGPDPLAAHLCGTFGVIFANKVKVSVLVGEVVRQVDRLQRE